MPPHRQIPTGASFSGRLAIFYAALFIALGVQLPYLPVWLAAKGLDARAIGVVLALPMVVRVVAIPLATRLADRFDALRALILIATAAAVAAYGALALTEGFVAIAVAYMLASAAYSPVMLLADAYALRGLAELGRAYGPVRLWGSAAFILGSFGAGALLDVIAARDLIWLITGGMGLALAAAAMLAPLGGRAVDPKGPAPSGRKMLRDSAFLAVIAAASLVQASHAVYYGFSTIAWGAAGLDGKAIGALWAIGVLAEITLFAISARLPAICGPTVLLLMGCAGAVVRWGAMAFDPPAAVLPALQCLHGLSFGATHLGAIGFVARTAPSRLAATAQGYLAVALGLAMAGAMGLAGVLYQRYGSLAYAAMALAAGIGALCALAAHRQR
jgi:MFS transporter, PPP family, 3-phenylpropionic acid transporter